MCPTMWSLFAKLVALESQIDRSLPKEATMTTTDEGQSLINKCREYGATTHCSKDIEAHHDLIEFHCEGHPKGT